MPVISLHDRGRIEPVLRRNAFLHIYALGDLDEFFWPFTTWHALEESGEIRAILLVYTAFETPTLMALGDAPYDPLHNLLTSARRLLPPKVYAHLSPGGRRRAGRNQSDAGPHQKMALYHPKLTYRASKTWSGCRRPMADLRAFGAVGYVQLFDPRQIDTGHYTGCGSTANFVSCRRTTRLFARPGVAALGNIVTHPGPSRTRLRGGGHGRTRRAATHRRSRRG